MSGALLGWVFLQDPSLKHRVPLSELIRLQELLRALHKAPSEWQDKLVACHCHPERTASVPHRAEGKMEMSKAPESCNLL